MTWPLNFSRSVVRGVLITCTGNDYPRTCPGTGFLGLYRPLVQSCVECGTRGMVVPKALEEKHSCISVQMSVLAPFLLEWE